MVFPDLGNPAIYYNDERLEDVLELNMEEVGPSVQLVCGVEAHPIPTLTWMRNDGTPANGVQSITGFR